MNLVHKNGARIFIPTLGIVLEWIRYVLHYILQSFFLSQWRRKNLPSVSVTLIRKGGSIYGTFLAVSESASFKSHDTIVLDFRGGLQSRKSSTLEGGARTCAPFYSTIVCTYISRKVSPFCEAYIKCIGITKNTPLADVFQETMLVSLWTSFIIPQRIMKLIHCSTTYMKVQCDHLNFELLRIQKFIFIIRDLELLLFFS